MWIDPKKRKPENKQAVLFKTVYLHNKKIRYGRFIDGGFRELEAPMATHDADSVWGWMPFEDSDKREGDQK